MKHMKKIFTYIACALLALGAVSCAKDGMKLPESEKDGLMLRFSLGNPTTKADRLSVGNEDRVNKIDYFFFKVVDGKLSEDTAPIIPMRTLTPDNKLAGSYELILTTADLTQIYADPDAEVGIYAIANFTGTYPETITLADLKKIEVRSTFAGTDRWPHPLRTDNNDLFFIMTGESVLDLAADNEIPLERLASKVTVEFTYNTVEDPHDSNIIWVPQDKGKETRVYLSNAIATTTLGGPLDTSVRPYVTDSGDTWRDGTRDIFEYSYDYMSDLKGAVPYYYTYPIKMEAGDANQPYIKLVLPWYAYEKSSLTATTADGETTYTVKEGAAPVKQKEVYYKIALPIEDLKEGNRIYQYTADIAIVGADTEVEIDATYYVKKWLFGDPVSSKLATGRYISLDIPKNTYDMYSSLAEILFVSSGDVDVIVNDIYQMYLGENTPRPLHFMQYNEETGKNEVTAGSQYVTVDGEQRTLLWYKNVSAEDIEGWVTVPKGTSILTINHPIDDNVDSRSFDMSPYVFNVTLHLHGETSTQFDKNIVITQYPAMYVTSIRSNGYVYVKGATYSTNTANTAPASTFVYNDVNNQEANRIGSVADRTAALNTTGNNNGYNMIVHPTALDPTLGLTIGEARVASGSTLANINGLTNYKPSREDITNLISPGFMIASSYGKTSRLANIDRAEERCASYQENGFPAGRWRVPTEGEIQFLIKLSNNGFIPSLFDGRYWASSNRFYYSEDNNFHPASEVGNNTQVAVRCVYDVWYWGETPMKANGTDATNYNETTRTWTDAATTWIPYKD